MAEDVVPGLLEDIQNRFRTNMNKSRPLQRVRQRMEAGTATLRRQELFTTAAAREPLSGACGAERQNTGKW